VVEAAKTGGAKDDPAGVVRPLTTALRCLPGLLLCAWYGWLAGPRPGVRIAWGGGP
jgi:hypothetical protein